VLHLPNRRFLLRLLAFTSACALLLPFYGAFPDHHFTERVPGHVHIYLGEISGEHVHPFEVPHSHGEGTGASSVPSGASGSEGKIIFLPPDEGGSPGSQHDSITHALLSSTSWLLIPSMLALPVIFGEPSLRSFVSRLLPPPPRLAL
jgi:hypothetical protein